ncbi:Nonribosomal peptide synthetase dtxS1 [Cladobotryum mycophilum]|uniref:Nonribosomal peptide synthetase dtxS1 n=1 Tax=Cladobotryum mycophilum TaxID=491253 RepID=A0ABR0SII5_9HYPO
MLPCLEFAKYMDDVYGTNSARRAKDARLRALREEYERSMNASTIGGMPTDKKSAFMYGLQSQSQASSQRYPQAQQGFPQQNYQQQQSIPQQQQQHNFPTYQQFEPQPSPQPQHMTMALPQPYQPNPHRSRYKRSKCQLRKPGIAKADTTIQHHLSKVRGSSDITISTLIRAAWALIAGRQANCDDVVFGITVSGRNAPVVGIDEMAGPTIATVPLRIKLNDQTVAEFLEVIQRLGPRNPARNMLERLELVMGQLVEPEKKISDIEIVTRKDFEQIWSWNKTVPETLERCVHNIIEQNAQARPDAPAVCAWDGELSYAELEGLASALSKHLVELGVGPGVIVPLCFEKSAWTIVALLGVLKAGGAFTLLDSYLPEQRLKLNAGPTNCGRQLRPVCVPSDQDRKSNLAGSLVFLKATSVLLTPSVSESLSPEKVPNLKAIIFGGEAVHTKHVTPWWGRVKYFTAYGSSECTTISTINTTAASIDEASRVGKGVGLVTWIVDADDHNKLLPLGCVGELLLEGPLVGRGYLNDADKTAAAFIEDPTWLVQSVSGLQEGRSRRLYKTGDLVQYNDDGSLTFLGRNDGQVKIRGQRIELGEVVVQVIVPKGDNASPALMVFLHINDSATEISDSATIVSIDPTVEEKMVKHLPSYIVPIVFSMKKLPMTPIGKMHRKRLREIGGECSVQQLAEMRTASSGPKRQPRTRVEREIQRIWGQVLNLDPETIGLDDGLL